MEKWHVMQEINLSTATPDMKYTVSSLLYFSLHFHHTSKRYDSSSRTSRTPQSNQSIDRIKQAKQKKEKTYTSYIRGVALPGSPATTLNGRCTKVFNTSYVTSTASTSTITILTAI